MGCCTGELATGTGVGVGGTGVAVGGGGGGRVGGTGVLVGTGVSVGGRGVSVKVGVGGISGVLVGMGVSVLVGKGVAVGGSGVLVKVGSGVRVGRAFETRATGPLVAQASVVTINAQKTQNLGVDLRFDILGKILFITGLRFCGVNLNSGNSSIEIKARQ